MGNKKSQIRELEPQFRNFEVRGINEESKTVELSFSSEEPYERWWGIEVLDHSTGSVNMERLNNGAPLLFNHNRDEVIGVIENAVIKEKRGHALVRFGNSAKAQEVFSDVVDGIMKNVSVGYQIDEMKLESEVEGVETYKVTRWQPFEISIVSIPADNSVGVGRSEELQKSKVKILNKKEEEKMEKTEEVKTLDVKVVESEATKAERARINEINSIARSHGLTTEAEKAIEEGVSLDKFRSIALAKISEKANQTVIDTKSKEPTIGMNEKEKKRYSLQKALWALANPMDKRAQEAAAFEYEISVEAQRAADVTASGILVPFDVFQRDLTVGGTGSNLVGSTQMGLVETLKNKSAVMQLAEVLPGLKGILDFPTQDSELTIEELGETEALTNSELTFGNRQMAPRRFAGGTNYSKMMLQQSSQAIENMISNELMGQIGLKIDADAVAKILAATGLGLVSIGDNGGALTNSHVVDLETEVADSNADFGKLAYLMNPRTRGFLKKTPITSGDSRMILTGNDLNGYSYGVSKQIPANLTKGTGTDLSALIFGNFQDLYIGLWGGIDLTVDIYTQDLRKAGLVGIQADQFADTFVRRGSSFSAVKDAIVS